MLNKLATWLGILAPPPPDYSAPMRSALDQFSSAIKLYHFFSCSFCARVHRTLHSLGLQLELRDVSENAEYRSELISGGGRSTVPCLRIQSSSGDVRWMYESSDIIAWLKQQVAHIISRNHD